MSIDRRTVIKSGLLLAATTTAPLNPDSAFAQPAVHKVAGADINHGSSHSGKVALTFHGAGADQYARSILDQAKEAGIGITIMAIGTWVQAKPTFARRVLAEGHDLGNHTMHHLGIKHMSLSNATKEITECTSIIKNATGQLPKWFRPSQTQNSNLVVRQAAGAAGFAQCITYNLDSLDYLDPAMHVVRDAVLHQVKAGDIISMHLGHEVTTRALAPILHGLAAKKLKPVTISDLLKA